LKRSPGDARARRLASVPYAQRAGHAANRRRSAPPGRRLDKQVIAALKIDKSVPEAEWKECLGQLEAALKNAKPIQFKESIALVVKYLDKLPPLMEQRPAD
jgi:hypothetical protein